MRAKHLLCEFYEPAEDEQIQHNYEDTRRPRLTMRHLHKIRMSRDTEAVDKQDYLDFIPQMYGSNSEEI